MDYIKVIETVGIPAAGAMGLGYLLWVLFKYFMNEINKKLDTQHGMIVALIDRIRQMDNDMIRIDAMVRAAMGLPPDIDRIARADGKKEKKEG